MDSVPMGEIINGKSQYHVPPYQRGYAWEDDQIDDFTRDLEETLDDDREHFFGFMLTVKNTDSGIKIIDGQQRMTTALLFLICARNFFYKHKHISLANDCLKNINTQLYLQNDRTNCVLILGKANQNFFSKIFTDHSASSEIIKSYSDRHDSNKHLARAYNKLQSWLSGYKINDVKNIVDTFNLRFKIQQHSYENDNEAYKVFNLLNNRGSPLDESDHVKNLLFGELGQRNTDTIVDAYDDVWEEIRSRVTGKQPNALFSLNAFFHHYLIVTNKYNNVTSRPSQNKMYSAFLHLLTKKDPKEEPSKLIDELKHWSKNLLSIRRPSLQKFDNDAALVHYLNELRNTRAIFVYPAILAAYETYWKGDYKSLFKIVVMMCFKYHLRVKTIGTGISVSDYETIMIETTKKIKADRNGQNLVQTLIRVVENAKYYPIPEKLRVDLKTTPMSGTKAKMLLQEAEHAISGNHISSKNVTAEHIMPKDIRLWFDYIKQHNTKRISDDQTDPQTLHQSYLDYLGNQTLLSSKNNKDAGSKPFKDKKISYKKSPQYGMTLELCDAPIWNIDKIIERHNNLIELICTELDLYRFIEYLNKSQPSDGLDKLNEHLSKFILPHKLLNTETD